MPDSYSTTPSPQTASSKRSSKRDEPSLSEVIEFIKAYAKQETLGPIKGAGSWLAFGAAGAFALGFGLFLVMLGLLRLIQFEWERSSSGALSWVAYLITFLVTLGLLGLTLARIKKNYLNKEAK